MFEEALRSIVGKLDRARAAGLLDRFGLIGGLAVSAWGVPRATRDIDFVIALGGGSAEALAASLGGHCQSGARDDPLRGVIRASVAIGPEAVPVQLIQFPPRWSDVALTHLETLDLLGCEVPVVSWHALVLLKLYAGGPHDLLDAWDLLRVRRPSGDDLRRLGGLAERVDLSKELQDLVSRLRGERPR